MTPEIPDDSDQQKHAEKHGISHKLRDKSLKAAGISCFIADLCLITAGIMAKDNGFWKAGAFGLTAGAVGTFFGNPKAEKQLDLLNRKLGEYLRKQGVKIPDDVTQESLTQEGGIVDHIKTFLYDHPSQVMNVCYGLIGTQLLGSGRKLKDNDLKICGSLLIGGALGGLLIHEKKPDPNHPPEGMLQKGASWIQEKPLRLTGTMFNVNVLYQAKHAYKMWRDHPEQKSYIPKMGAVAAFAFGNTMFALSSKSEGGGKPLDKSTLDALSTTSAHIIASQPTETQGALLEQVAGFLAAQPSMKLKAPEIGAMLREKLDREVAARQAAANWQERASSEPASAPLQR